MREVGKEDAMISEILIIIKTKGILQAEWTSNTQRMFSYFYTKGFSQRPSQKIFVPNRIQSAVKDHEMWMLSVFDTDSGTVMMLNTRDIES